MDISHGGGATTRELASLTGLTTAALVGGIAAIHLTGLMISRTQDFSPIAPFGGWQLYSVAGVIGAACIAVLLFAVRVARRQFRRVRGRSRFHRVAVMAAIVPGLVLGVAVASTVRPALHWASLQTAESDKARAEQAAFVREYRQGPPVVSYRDLDATDPRLQLLLDPRALGSDWHARFLERSHSPTDEPAVTGGVDGVLTAQHWSGTTWQYDEDLIEHLTTLATPAKARAYVTRWTRQDGAVCGCTPVVPTTEPADCSCTMTKRVVDGHRVSVQMTSRPGYGVSRRAVFAVGNNVFTLFSFPPRNSQAQPVSFSAALRAAVNRAT